MTKTRQKSSEKTSAPILQEDASKKSSKSSTNGMSGPGPQGPTSGSCLGLLVTTVVYIAVIGAVGFAAFYFQQVVDEIRQMNAEHQKSAQQNSELRTKMENVVQQVESQKRIVDGLESSLGVTRVELEAAVSRMKRGEVETRRVEEALQKLQNEILRDLSEGIKEVKEARGSDFSSLEKTVEERLAEVSQSISASLAEFAEAQGEAQSQLDDLKTRLGGNEDPGLIKQELSAIADAVAEIKMTKNAADTTAHSLREQIEAVREELQTRNKEVASLSQEIQSVRLVVQETTGSLKTSLSATEAGVHDLKGQTETLQGKLEQFADAVRNLEKIANAAAAAQVQSQDFETRVKASEENRDSLSASLSDISNKVESLLARYVAHESSLAANGEAVEKVKTDLKVMKSSVDELQSNTPLSGGQTEPSEDFRAELETRLSALEDSGSRIEPEELENLKTTVDHLKSKAAELEGHNQAISTLQEALQEMTKKLTGLSEANQGERSSEELQSKMAALSETQNELNRKDSRLDQQVEELEKRLTALEDRI